MKHLGDITQISGYDVPLVDVVIGGSPCQDLSVAGKQQGLAGSRSGLFMEQIRLVKEMRKADEDKGDPVERIRPRYMLWENVVGAFSSNKGADFKIVLEETIRIAEPTAPDVPLPANGKWPLADAYYGDGWSVAYRVFDAQFWGVPQRRRRIALVVDFGGHTAPEILFVRESVSGNLAPGGTQGQDAPACIKSRSATANRQAVINEVRASGFKAGQSKAGGLGWQDECAATLSAQMSGTEPTVCVYTWDARGHGDGQTASTITGDHERRVSDYGSLVVAVAQNQRGELRLMEKMPSLTTGGGKPGEGFPCALVYPINDKATRFQGGGPTRKGDGAGNGLGIGAPGDPSPTLTATDRHAVMYCMAHGQANAEICENMSPTLNCNHEQPIVAAIAHGIVRRLTPLECERLQGFPDGWTDIGEWVDEKGKRHPESSDAARYTALGNSIAIPPWKFVLKRLCSHYERDATMASLFDGIGGFPYIWEQLNGKGSCLWASEVEQFPIAVTKRRFGVK